MEENRYESKDRGEGGRSGGRREGGGGGRDRGDGGARFNRKKVCPFILDKTLLLDYKNLKVVFRFVTETGRIVPRRVSGATAKNQRRLTKHIKRARNLGFIAPAIIEE